MDGALHLRHTADGLPPVLCGRTPPLRTALSKPTAMRLPCSVLIRLPPLTLQGCLWGVQVVNESRSGCLDNLDELLGDDGHRLQPRGDIHRDRFGWRSERRKTACTRAPTVRAPLHIPDKPLPIRVAAGRSPSMRVLHVCLPLVLSRRDAAHTLHPDTMAVH